MKNIRLIPPVELVAGAAIELKQEGDNHPHYKDIRARIDKIYRENQLNGEVQSSVRYSSQELILGFLSKVPLYLTVRGVMCVPVNGPFYVWGCPKPKSLDHAMRFLTNGGNPIAGTYFPTEEDDLISLAYIYKEQGYADRKLSRYDNRTIQALEDGTLSKEQAEKLLEHAETMSGIRFTGFRARLSKF